MHGLSGRPLRAGLATKSARSVAFQMCYNRVYDNVVASPDSIPLLAICVSRDIDIDCKIKLIRGVTVICFDRLSFRSEVFHTKVVFSMWTSDMHRFPQRLKQCTVLVILVNLETYTEFLVS